MDELFAHIQQYSTGTEHHDWSAYDHGNWVTLIAVDLRHKRIQNGYTQSFSRCPCCKLTEWRDRRIVRCSPCDRQLLQGSASCALAPKPPNLVHSVSTELLERSTKSRLFWRGHYWR